MQQEANDGSPTSGSLRPTQSSDELDNADVMHDTFIQHLDPQEGQSKRVGQARRDPKVQRTPTRKKVTKKRKKNKHPGKDTPKRRFSDTEDEVLLPIGIKYEMKSEAGETYTWKDVVEEFKRDHPTSERNETQLHDR